MVLKQLNDFVWGPWMLFFILGTGLFLAVRLKFLPIRNLGRSLNLFIKSFKQSERSFETLMTSLGAMMGTGNILGVTTAISHLKELLHFYSHCLRFVHQLVWEI